METIQGVDGMHAFAAQFVQSLAPREGRATLVTLSGELGAGKTTFVQGVAKAVGIADQITSPTFVIEKVYELSPESGHGFVHLVHIDAYRLNGAQELRVLGWDQILSDSKNLILIEWPEMVQEAIPEDAIRVSFHGSGDMRKVGVARATFE